MVVEMMMIIKMILILKVMMENIGKKILLAFA